MDDMKEKPPPWIWFAPWQWRTATGCLLALLGAVSAHVIVWAATFAGGACLGCSWASFGVPQAPGPKQYGVRGGECAIDRLLVYYLFSLGIVPVLVTIAGVVAVFVVRRFLRRFSR
jgi:hypothetical protein